MPTERPTASVTGNQSWDWNREYADPPFEHETDTETPQGQAQKSSKEATPSQPTYRELQQQVVQLDTELKQKDRQLQYVIDHYEQLLSEKNQELRRQAPPRDRTECDPGGLVDCVREVTER